MMIKTVTAWILISVGVLILIAVITFIAINVFYNIRTRSPDQLNYSIFQMPTFVGYSMKFMPKSPMFLTSSWIFLTGHVGIALLLIATGLHLKLLHTQDLGEQQLKRLEITEQEKSSVPFTRANHRVNFTHAGG